VHLRAAISRKKKTLKLVFPSKQLSLRNSYHGYCKVKLYFCKQLGISESI